MKVHACGRFRWLFVIGWAVMGGAPRKQASRSGSATWLLALVVVWAQAACSNSGTYRPDEGPPRPDISVAWDALTFAEVSPVDGGVDTEAGPADTTSPDVPPDAEDADSPDLASPPDAGDVSADASDVTMAMVHDGVSVRENTCPGGLEWLRGTWRYYEDYPRLPAPELFAERLSFQGDRWVDRLRGTDRDQPTDATVDGWYLCAEPPDVRTSLLVFVTTRVVPAGAFGYAPELVWSARVIRDVAQPDDDIALVAFEGIDGESFGQFSYCRVGSRIQGHWCDDPFAEEP